MRRMFNVAPREWKWTKDNPVDDLSFAVGNKNARDRWLTVEEEKLLLSTAINPYWLMPLLIMTLYTGLSRRETLNLTWKDIDFVSKVVSVMKSKSAEKRIPMSQTLVMTLRLSGRVFPIAVRSLREAYEKTLKKRISKTFVFTISGKPLQQGSFRMALTSTK